MALTLLLALSPAAAFADGAGDDQYQDPLVAPSTPKKKKKAASTAPSSTTPAATTAPAATSAPAAAKSTQTTAAPSASSQELPRTGAPAGLVGLAGAGLIASGAILRRRTASQ
jgi:LPXTG-motif cell wall-anchored protein